MTHLGKRRYNVSLPKVNNRRDGASKENDGDLIHAYLLDFRFPLISSHQKKRVPLNDLP